MKLPDFILSEPLAFHVPALAAWLQRYDRIQDRLAALADARATVSAGQTAVITLADFIHGRRSYEVTPEGFALIHVNESLSRTATGFDLLLGDTHYNQLIAELATAAAAPDVRGILLEVSSPGGSAIGAPEAAAAVAAARQVKPIVAYVEVVGASAAYYFAAAAHGILASPSAIVGSIGTIAMYENIAGLLARIGIGVEIITPAHADLKASGNQVRPITEPERGFLQGRIEAMNADFTGWVQQHRGAPADALRGQWFSGKEAVAAGLVDATGTRADALATLATLAG